MGLVQRRSPSGKYIFSGSCFLFRHDDVILTARHCIGDWWDNTELVFPRLRVRFTPERVEYHPSADVALLFCGDKVKVDQDSGYPDHGFWDGVGNWALGEEFMTFGYPSDGPAPETAPGTPTPRLFVGHYQRFYEYSSPAGFRYLAGELSIPAPGGLSGAPVFRPGAPVMVTGLVTANQESYAVSDSIDTVEADGTHYRQESRKIISYGVVLMLSGIVDWLNRLIPTRGGRSWVLQPPESPLERS